MRTEVRPGLISKTLLEVFLTMNHKQLVQQMNEMKAQLEGYQSELTNLRSQVTSYENVETPIPTNTGATSRRKLLKRMAIAGIGGIGAIGLAAATNPNYTVLAETTPDNAIEAVGGTGGYGLKASGGLAPLFLGAGAGIGAPVFVSGAVPHSKGELYVDNAGSLFYCIADGNPGTWRQLAGSSTSGTMHLLPKPVRFVDSRPSVALNDSSGAYTHQQIRTYNLPGLTIAGGNPLPSGALGVVGNITASKGGLTAAQQQSGFLSVSPTNTINFSTDPSVVNFQGGITLANNFSVGLSGGSMSVGAFFQTSPGTGGINIIIDIAGYYL
jgi:hypothetical protein